MAKNHIRSLDKATRDRHFPELNGGKGSKPRKSTDATRDAFKKGYDAIDWSKK